MATYVLKDCRFWMAGYDLTTDIFSLALKIDADVVDKTAFTNSTRQRLAGLFDAEANFEGFVNLGADAVEDVLFSKHGSRDELVTICPMSGALGDIVYAMQGVETEFSPGGEVGQMYEFSATALASGSPVLRGTLMEFSAKTATANGTGRQLGAVGATQKLYAGIHIIAVSGTDTPTITLKVQSDDNSGFTSATDRITFAAKTAIGAEYATPVSGAITDDWWRFIWTVSGTNPSLTAVAWIAIQ